MSNHPWVQEFPGALTVCDTDGTIIEMNDQAAKIFEKDGGKKLLGRNVLDCHPEPARTKLKDILDNRKTHVYTIEKAGLKKLIYQAPWFRNGRYSGMVEVSLEIPFDLPHFVR